MKTLKIFCNLMLLILLAGSTGCVDYIKAKLSGCGDYVEKVFEIPADEIQGKYFNHGANGTYVWLVTVDSICVKQHINTVMIEWKVSNNFYNQLTDYAANVDIGFYGGSDMTNSVKLDENLQERQITFLEQNIGLKQTFAENEPGWIYVRLTVAFESKGSQSADLEFIKANWKSCGITVMYNLFDPGI